MKNIEIKNWKKFQQYHDRRPTWIKLRVEVLDEYDEDGNLKKFRRLPDTAKLTFLLLLCLRTHFNGNIPYPDDKWLRDKLGIRTLNLQPLVNAGYINVCTESVQDCTEVYKNDTSETETETETEREHCAGNPRSIPDMKEDFNIARMLYKGTCQGLDREFDAFTRRHENWREIIPLLAPAIKLQIAHRQEVLQAGGWVPQWKHFRTWLYNGCWEEEAEKTAEDEDKLCVVDGNPGVKFQLNGKGVKVWLCQECYDAISKTTCKNTFGKMRVETIKGFVSKGKGNEDGV